MLPRLTTLRGLLLWYLLAPLSLLWIFNLVVTFYFANNFSNIAYDRALFIINRTLAAQIQIRHGQASVDLPQVAWDMLYFDDYDKVFSQVRWAGGGMIAGNSELEPPPAGHWVSGKPIFHDGTYQGLPVRIASLYMPVDTDGTPRQLLVQTAETLNKRRILKQEIISGVIIPQLILILLAAASIWAGVGRGLEPLRRIRDAISNRSHRDLSPVAEHSAPQEIQPLLHSTNELMHRLNHTLNIQQRFVADAAHQLRTPLAGLITQTEYALRQADPVQLQHALKQIKTSAERSNHLIHQLLTLARSEASSNSSSVFEPLDLNQLLAQLTSEWVPTAMNRDVDLGYEGPDGAVMVKGNAVLLREMMANLLDNAIRYIPQGGNITVHLSNTAHPLITVVDNGPGIPVKERERVFERFTRLLGSEGDGSGLGLAIVREIAMAHGARVWLADGAGGKGTQVCVHFEHSA